MNLNELIIEVKKIAGEYNAWNIAYEVASYFPENPQIHVYVAGYIGHAEAAITYEGAYNMLLSRVDTSKIIGDAPPEEGESINV